jgi:hypothetical protein
VNSDDEFDEFFDRTKKEQVKVNQPSMPAATETYEILKHKLESLCSERQHLTAELKTVQSGTSVADEEDELDAYMNVNAAKLKQEKIGKISSRLV